MQNTTAVGYTQSIVLRNAAPYRDPLEHRQGYTQPCLTLLQHGTVVTAASFAAACVSRPMSKLDQFYFLSDVPGESNRIFMSDKRAQFFRVLFGTRWWAGRSLLWGMCDHAFCLVVFVALRHCIEATRHGPGADLMLGGTMSNAQNGVAAGALTGAAYAAVRHPHDVLRATAEAPGGPKVFRGPADVLWTALRERPAVLAGLYRGFSAVVLGRSAQFAVQLGLYNALRYDGVYRGPVVLFLYCHVATFIGLALNYPLLAVRQQLLLANAATRGQRLTYRSVLFDLRRRHGITKVYDGFFGTRPWLNALGPALAMLLYDVGSRRYTEYLHPNLRANAVPEQSLTSKRAPSHVTQPQPYEFKH